MIRLQRLVGTLENFNENQYHSTIAKSVLKIDPDLTDSNKQLFNKLKTQTRNCDSQLNKTVSEKLYTYCSEQNKDVTSVIRNASDILSIPADSIQDQELREYMNTNRFD